MPGLRTCLTGRLEYTREIGKMFCARQCFNRLNGLRIAFHQKLISGLDTICRSDHF